MRKLRKYSLLRGGLVVALLCLLCSGVAQAQYYSWGPSPANVKWRKLQTEDVKLLYPSYFEDNARRVIWYLDTLRTHIDFGYRYSTMRSPVVLHTQNMMGNGMVMWAPKRIELLAAPSVAYSEPWLKQLVLHEYRHNVQYNNLRRGVVRPLMWLLGEQAGFLGTGQFSIYIIEGDAVMAETEMSAFGRGLQPSFTIHYRAMGDVGSDGRAGDYWFCGSLRDFVPDHYRLGYQMVRWSYNHFDKFIWDDIARYVSRNPQFISPMSIGLKKMYEMNQSELFRRTFTDLNAYWNSLPRVEDSSLRIPTPETSYTTYQWPLWLNDSTLVAFKSDFDRPSRIVQVDATTGAEEILAHTGIVSSRPVLADGRLWWTEYRSSTLWAEKVLSQLCSYDLATGNKSRKAGSEFGLRGKMQVLYPVALPDGSLACVAYDYSGQYSIIIGEDIRVEFPLGMEVTGLAWDDVTRGLYFIGLDDGGMYLGVVEGSGFRKITPSKHITISELRASDGKLYFGSIVSGKDEAHAYDLATRSEYRLSTSAYGSFQPSTPFFATGDSAAEKIALTTYDRHGYHLAVQNLATAIEQEERTLPLDLVNPDWKRWEGMPRMDSLVYTPAAAEHSRSELKPRKYRRMLHLFQPHSWLPLGFYPPAAIQEADLTIHAGATVMSQNLLSDAVTWLSYGWTGRQGGSMLRGGFSYRGLGPVLDVEATWGGARQTLYTDIPQSIGLNLKPYFSITTRLSLPLTLGTGYWQSRLTPSVEYFYTNGLIFRPITDQAKGELTRGVERLNFALSYTGQVRMAYKEFLPRWAVTARAGYVTNPTNNQFKDVWMASVGAWLPGVVRPHSLNLRAAWQQTSNQSDTPFLFRLKEVFPRGADYDFAVRRMAKASVDYQLPVWYPEGGWTSIIYFKRVRLNVFADLAHWQDFSTDSASGGRWRNITSYGGDIILDISPLRMPATTHVSVKLTVAKPSDRRGVFFGFGLDVPL